jgi:hypothetical protein
MDEMSDVLNSSLSGLPSLVTGVGKMTEGGGANRPVDSSESSTLPPLQGNKSKVKQLGDTRPSHMGFFFSFFYFFLFV